MPALAEVVVATELEAADVELRQPVIQLLIGGLHDEDGERVRPEQPRLPGLEPGEHLALGDHGHLSQIGDPGACGDDQPLGLIGRESGADTHAFRRRLPAGDALTGTQLGA